VLDDGRITDSQGRTVDFKNTVIIMTSNIGAHALLGGISSNGEISSSAKEQVTAELKARFRPEFLNRLDEIVFFKPLTESEIGKIVDLFLNGVVNRLAEKQITLTVTDCAKKIIVDGGYDANFGARPLKRFIERNIESMLAKEIIRSNPPAGSVITVDGDGENLFIAK
jgi:ATP-dependent Clp protease ATP-binding subunit ClpB